MALLPINAPQGQRKDSMDKILQGLQIANEVFKIPVAYQNLSANREQAELLRQKAPLEQEKLRAETENTKLMNPIERRYKTAQAGQAEAETRKILAEAGPGGAKAQQVAVPGFNLTPGFRPSAEEAGKVKESKASYDTVSAQIDNLSNLVKENGTELLPTQAKRDMSLYHTDIKLQIKNLAQLGQISASDATLLSDMVPDPTSMKEQANPYAAEQMVSTYDKLKETLAEKVMQQAKSKGYAPASPIYTKQEKKSGSSLIPEANAATKPEVVNQNGHTYRLNKKTGKYE